MGVAPLLLSSGLAKVSESNSGDSEQRGGFSTSSHSSGRGSGRGRAKG